MDDGLCVSSIRLATVGLHGESLILSLIAEMISLHTCSSLSFFISGEGSPVDSGCISSLILFHSSLLSFL